MSNSIEIRSVASGFNYVVKRGVNSEGYPTEGITKGWAATESQARKKAQEAI